MNEFGVPGSYTNYLFTHDNSKWRYNCPIHEPSGKYFAGSERFTNLLKDSDIVIDMQKFEDDNKISQILQENVPHYPDE